MTNFLSFGLKAYKGSESQKIGRICDLKGKDEWRENLSEGFDSLLEDCRVNAIRILSAIRRIESLMTGIIWGSNADYLQIIYLNNQLSQMSTWLHISGLIFVNIFLLEYNGS
jgi:hypothetical protein